MRPPAEQLIRDYLNRLSVAARNRLKPEDRRAFLARTGDFIERQSGVRGTADPAEVMRILSGIGEPETVVERERVRLEQRRQEQAAKASRVTLWKPRREDPPPASPDSGLTNKDGRPLTGEIRVTSRPITSRWKPGEPLKPTPASGKIGRSGRGSWIPRPRRGGSAPPPPDETGPETPEPPPRERPSASPSASPAGSAPAASPGATSPGSGGATAASPGSGASAGSAAATSAGTGGPTSAGSRGATPAGSGGVTSPGSGGPGGATAAGPGSGASAGSAAATSAGTGGPTAAGSRGASAAGTGGAGPAGSAGAVPAGTRNGASAGSNGTGHIHQVPSATPAPRGTPAPPGTPAAPGAPATPATPGTAATPASPASPGGPAGAVPPQAAGPAAGPLTPGSYGDAESAQRFAGRTVHIGLPGHTVRIGRVPRPSRPARTRLARSAALPRPRRRLQPGDMTLVLARRAADTGRQHRMEAACVVLMIIAGVIYPFPLWLAGFLIWLVAVVITTMSTVWSLPDKWVGIVGPVALVIIGTATLISLEGTLATFPDYVHEALADSVWLIKVGALLGGVFLGWRLQRGRSAPAVPPWLRRNSRR